MKNIDTIRAEENKPCITFAVTQKLGFIIIIFFTSLVNEKRTQANKYFILLHHTFYTNKGYMVQVCRHAHL